MEKGVRDKFNIIWLAYNWAIWKYCNGIIFWRNDIWTYFV